MPANWLHCMGLMSFLFSRSELSRTGRPKLGWLPAHSSRRTSAIHWICALVVLVASLLLVVTSGIDVFGKQDVIIAESAALIAFGVSWFYKGFELDLLIPSRYPN